MLGGMIVYRHRDVFASRWSVGLSGIFAAVMAAMMLGTLLALEFESPVDVPKSLVLLAACPFLMFSQISLLRTLLENAVARHLGVVSYSIYLWQLPIIQELQKHGWLVDALTLSAIVIAVGTLSYFLIEKPFLTWFRAGQAKPVTLPAGAVKSAA
jgi:peptidoglycan/LPS O-acetylase OafA/YrhL